MSRDFGNPMGHRRLIGERLSWDDGERHRHWPTAVGSGAGTCTHGAPGHPWGRRRRSTSASHVPEGPKGRGGRRAVGQPRCCGSWPLPLLKAEPLSVAVHRDGRRWAAIRHLAPNGLLHYQNETQPDDQATQATMVIEKDW